MANSFVGRWFKLEGSGALREREGSRFTVRLLACSVIASFADEVRPFQTEIRAGLTTWAAMAYIVRRPTADTADDPVDLAPISLLHHSWAYCTAITAMCSAACYTQIAVNASIVSQSGGPCVCTQDDLCVTDDTYLTCVRCYITLTYSTIIALALSLFGRCAYYIGTSGRRGPAGPHYHDSGCVCPCLFPHGLFGQPSRRPGTRTRSKCIRELIISTGVE